MEGGITDHIVNYIIVYGSLDLDQNYRIQFSDYLIKTIVVINNGRYCLHDGPPKESKANKFQALRKPK